MSDIKALVAKLNKQYGENTIGFASNLKYGDLERLSTGSLYLDYALGTTAKNEQSGWPMGRIIELYGPESSGKSLICLKTIVEAQKRDILCAYIDCENTFDNKYAEFLGVDTSKLLMTRISQAETVFDVAADILKNHKKVQLIVFDSLASMIPKVEIDASLEDQQMAAMARVMSKGLRKLITLNDNNCTLIWINQLRENPGAKYGNPEYTPGGRAIKFYASIRAEIKRGDWIFDPEDKKKKIGQVVRFRIVKNKTSEPNREGTFNYLYEDGIIDPVDQLVSVGLWNETISQKGSYYSILDRSHQGREGLENALRKDSKFFELAKKEVFGEKKEESK